MKKYSYVIITALLIFLSFSNISKAQANNEEPIKYFQMETLDDSLFIKIQMEVFIDPPDPKAEIIVDLRDANNQTVSIKGTLYPFLAFSPTVRAKIITYPFKLNLEKTINFGSVFTRVVKKMKFKKMFEPPTKNQISSTLYYINPFLQLFGGEQLGIPFKKDIGFSIGMGTPYSGPLETNFVQANFHILGFYAGAFGPIEEFTQVKTSNNHNNLYVTSGYQFGYVIPFGNFLEINFMKITVTPSQSRLDIFNKYNIDSLGYRAKILEKSYSNWEFRYPISVLGSTRGKFYIAKYVNEYHFGFAGRELSLAGSVFDLRMDYMSSSDVRQPQFLLEIMVQKIAESWGSSSFAIGPAVIFSKDESGKIGAISIFANFRFKLGTSF